MRFLSVNVAVTSLARSIVTVHVSTARMRAAGGSSSQPVKPVKSLFSDGVAVSVTVVPWS